MDGVAVKRCSRCKTEMSATLLSKRSGLCKDCREVLQDQPGYEVLDESHAVKRYVPRTGRAAPGSVGHRTETLRRAREEVGRAPNA